MDTLDREGIYYLRAVVIDGIYLILSEVVVLVVNVSGDYLDGLLSF